MRRGAQLLAYLAISVALVLVSLLAMFVLLKLLSEYASGLGA